ncbi:serine hydrolase domain-containing protein [Tenacibaculum amylolyticum]|uniref:serine hydrolase domain-containing protein n=1 Tax=Tenacibaculum amylolyticum TaxID=104269 RepID=UPI0038932A1C
MKILRNILQHALLVILLFFNSCINSQNTIESIMDDYAENGRKTIGSPFTGTVLVAKKGKILFEGSYGFKDRKNKIPNTIDTKFLIGSLTKQFVAMLSMQLMEQGRLQLDDPVTKYLKYMPKKYNDITIHQLLSHTSGLPHYEGFVAIGINKNALIHNAYTPKELALLISKVALRNESKSNTTFHYSSLGYMLLGAIIEEASGKSFSELLKIHITEPLGLKNTGFASNEFVKKEVAKGYAFKEDKTYKMILKKYGGEFKEVPYRDQSNSYTAGGMYSTVNDLFIWSEAIKNNKLISEETTKQMLQPVQQGYAYGWIRNWEDIMERNIKGQLYSHTGSTFGHASTISMFDDGTTIIFTANVNRIKAQKIIHNLYLAANDLEDVYHLKGYPDRSSLAEFEEDGGIEALHTYFKELSDLCGYQVKPSSGSLQQIITLYYKNGKITQGDSIRNAYIKLYHPSEEEINRLGYRIMKFNCLKSIEILEYNTQNFSNSANAWDSLGEAYVECKSYKKAFVCLEKAVSLAINSNNPNLTLFQKRLKKIKSLVK